MASSVSSERAFFSAGITISKCRNRLKGDIVEALQFLKCFIRRDFLFRIPEVLVDDEEQEVEAVMSKNGGNGASWDILLDDDPDNYDVLTTTTTTDTEI